MLASPLFRTATWIQTGNDFNAIAQAILLLLQLSLRSLSLCLAPMSCLSDNEKNQSLRKELQRVLKENRGLREEVSRLRDECEQLHAAQAESQQRLVSRETWPGYHDIEEPAPRDHYTPSEIIIALKREFQIPYDDNDAVALLRKYNFNPDDVREVANVSRHDDDEEENYFPMEWFSERGDLLLCQWLHANGAAHDTSRIDNESGQTPMLVACEGGHLSVCKWLFEVGADGDISRANTFDWTPMMLACANGHLSVCEWLYKVGAEEDIFRLNYFGSTPMYQACYNGHLSICEWLYKMGANEDISRADNYGDTPMKVACENDHLSVCGWLVLKGALNDPDSAGQHITQAIVERDVVAPHSLRGPDRRPLLLAWAQGVVAASDSFRNTVLMGTFSPPSSTPAAITALLRRALITAGNAAANAEMIVAALSEDQRAPLLQQLRPRPAFSKLSGLTDALELVADFLDVWRGRELRNAREFAGCLLSSLV